MGKRDRNEAKKKFFFEKKKKITQMFLQLALLPPLGHKEAIDTRLPLPTKLKVQIFVVHVLFIKK